MAFAQQRNRLTTQLHRTYPRRQAAHGLCVCTYVCMHAVCVCFLRKKKFGSTRISRIVYSALLRPRPMNIVIRVAVCRRVIIGIDPGTVRVFNDNSVL